MASASASTPSVSTSTDAPAASTALSTTRALDAFKASANAQSGHLRCNNPKCWHLFAHDGDDDTVTFTPKVDADGNFTAPTVEVEMNGKMQLYYRLQQGDRIYLANRAGDVALRDSVDVKGNYICGECHDGGCHIAARGLCRCALDELGDAATPNGRATRGTTAAAPKPPTIADANGPMLHGLMMLNDNSFKDHATIVKLSEEAMDESRDREGTGGTAQRKAILQARNEKMQQLKHEAAKKINEVKSVETEVGVKRKRLEAEQKTLKTFKSGHTIAEDELSDQEVDVGDEDAEAAAKCFEEHKDVKKLRDEYPMHAQRWYGNVPTDKEIADQEKVIADTVKEIAEEEEKLSKATEEQDKAKDAFAIVEKEAEDVQKQMVADYEGDEDAEAEAPKPKKGKAKKRVDEMNPEELAAHKLKSEEDAHKRRENNKAKREMLDAYPRMREKAEKYEEMRKSARIYRAEMTKFKAAAEEKQEELEKATNRFDDLNESVAIFLENVEDKPAGWDPKAMLTIFKKHAKSVRVANAEKRKLEAEEAEAAKAAEADA